MKNCLVFSVVFYTNIKTKPENTKQFFIFLEESVPSIMLLLKKLGEDMLLSSTIPSELQIKEQISEEEKRLKERNGQK